MQKAFNAGYFLEKHQPKLARQIAKGLQNPETEFAQGFVAGRKQVEMERSPNKSRFFEKLKMEHGVKTSTKIKSKDKDKGIDIDI